MVKTFKVGDKVKILRAAMNYESGWQNTWERSMNDAVGKIGKVVWIPGSKNNIQVEVEGISRYSYPDFVLEKVIDTPVPVLAPVATTDRGALKADAVLASKFKAGDKVRATFVDYDSKNEGKTAKVTEIHNGYVKVQFEEDAFTVALFPQRLTLIESKATITGLEPGTVETKIETKPIVLPIKLSDFKTGDRVEVKHGYGWDGPGTVVRIGYANVIVQLDNKPKGFHGGFNLHEVTKISSLAIEPGQLEKFRQSRAVTTGVHTGQGTKFVFNTAYTAAVKLARANGVTNADEVQASIAQQGITPAQLGNAAGAIFRSKNFQKVGTIKSTRPGNHSRTISTWKYVGA